MSLIRRTVRPAGRADRSSTRSATTSPMSAPIGFKASNAEFRRPLRQFAARLRGRPPGRPAKASMTSSLSQLFTEGTINTDRQPAQCRDQRQRLLSGPDPVRESPIPATARSSSTPTATWSTTPARQVMGFARAGQRRRIGPGAGPLGTIQIGERQYRRRWRHRALTMNVNLPSTDTPINTVATPFSRQHASQLQREHHDARSTTAWAPPAR